VPAFPAAQETCRVPDDRDRLSEIGLDDLRPGETGEVCRVEAETRLATRLADLGFCPGTPVRVVRRAPLGDPVLYELRGYQIALRRGEAHRIRIRADRAAGAGETPP
jgi:Fe2+ transport system protein FeoA